jgi:hypothetical protein
VSRPSGIDRRGFLRTTVAGTALLSVFTARPAAGSLAVSLVADPTDRIASSPAVDWALGQLQQALTEAGVSVYRCDRVEHTHPDDLCMVAAGAAHATVASAIELIPIGSGPERLAIAAAHVSGRQVLLACGTDARGLSYALLDLTERVRSADSVADALARQSAVVERPSNAVRSVMRQVTSEILDKPWFEDREMWSAYLSMLATNRFNRLHLGFGLGYDFLQQVADSYLLFLYPFLVDVPGYNVRVTNVSAADRDRHLAALRFVSEQTVARGLDFQLGIWMHGYELARSPDARYIVEGLTRETHAAYCRDALTMVLRACPSISAVALRIHGESGVAEGSYDFWRTVFDGVARCGRRVEIDLHAKGIDRTMIDHALATGMPVNVSPKYWAEHLGIPYHQTVIRDLELPVAGKTGQGLMALSEGSRSFTRYGYADLLRDDRQYTVRHRVWAGTQRLLASGDLTFTSAYSRAFQFCGSTGMDLMEPLTFRGRRGTSIPGTRRSGYTDASLEPRQDWEKYDSWYRLWGRVTYNAGATLDDLQRGASALPPPVASALARATRILPIVTTAYLPSAACDAYWPEIYWNQPMAAEPKPNPFGDTPSPKTFQHASPLDPAMFSTMSEHADELLGRIDGSAKYSPIEVAEWLRDLADGVMRDLASFKGVPSAATHRVVVDATIQAGLGRFFAAKFRAGVLYAIHERTGDRRALDETLAGYGDARRAWAELAEQARTVYAADLSASDKLSERGQWLDRLQGIDSDIKRIAERRSSSTASDDAAVTAAVDQALGHERRDPAPCTHTPPVAFQRGAPLSLQLKVTGSQPIARVVCHYRHVNQAERFEQAEMAARGETHEFAIPASYTESPYPLQYYFTLIESPARAHLFPGLGPDLTTPPYFVVR